MPLICLIPVTFTTICVGELVALPAFAGACRAVVFGGDVASIRSDLGVATTLKTRPRLPEELTFSAREARQTPQRPIKSEVRR